MDKDYRRIYVPEHPKATKSGWVREHIVRAEKALGEPLPIGAEVHHVDGSKSGGPLVICQDHEYHHLLHKRQKSYEACGHANWRKCLICKKYDSPDNLKIYKDKNPYYASRAYHLECKRDYEKVGRDRRRHGYADKMEQRAGY